MLLLIRGKYAQLSGLLLMLNGVACIIGEIGVVADSKLIDMGSLAGGALFLVALAPQPLMFLMELEI